MKLSSLEENAELLIQNAKTAVAAWGIKSQGDLGLALESGVSHLEGTLKSVVDVVIDKMDVMAEVRRGLKIYDYVLTVVSWT